MNRNDYELNRSAALLLETAVRSGITSPIELANILGNSHVETAGFTTMHENFGYRSARSLVDAVSSADERYSWQEIEAAVASHDPRAIATIMYEGRRDLGNTEAGDGWRFHGRGYFQYTGRENYTRYGEKFGVDLANHPDVAAQPEIAAELAIAYWKEKVPAASRGDVVVAARVINGGDNGMDARIAASRRWQHALTTDLIEAFQSGRFSHGDYPEAPVHSGPKARPNEHEPARGIERSGLPPPIDDSLRGNPLFQRIRDGVRELDRQAGKDWDENSERLSASLLVKAIERGFTERDDLKVAFNVPTDKLVRGEIVHVFRQGAGASPDPAANRTHVRTADALSTPVDESLRQAESLACSLDEARHVGQRKEVRSLHADHVMRM